MATILDIAGKPLPPRNQSKRRLRAQDMRDLLKVVIVLLIVILGYLTFAPNREAPQATDIALERNARAG